MFVAQQPTVCNSNHEHAIEQHEQWAFLSQLGRVLDAFTELDAVTPQSALSDIDILFPHCESRSGDCARLNEIVAQLLTPFLNSDWRNAEALLRKRYSWDDPVMANFSNRATMAQMRREAQALKLAA